MILQNSSDPHRLPIPCESNNPAATTASAAHGNGKPFGVRERLKRHREEVAGNVTVPEKWGKEGLLKDWIDYAAFDRVFAPGRIASARESLVAEGRRASSRRALRVESSC